MSNSKNEDVIFQVKRMMTLSAIWPKSNENFAYKFRHFIWNSLSFVQIILMIHQLIVNINFIETVTDILCLIATYGSYLIKFTIFVNKRETFLYIIEILEQKSFVNYPKQFDHYTQNAISISNWVCRMYQTTCFIVVMIYTLKPIFIKEGQNLPIEVAFDVGNYYYLIYAIASISLLTTAWNNSSLDSLAMGLMSIASAQFGILREKLLTLNNYKEEDVGKRHVANAIEAIVKDCVKHHMDIIQ